MELLMTIIFLIVAIIAVFIFRRYNREVKHESNKWKPTFKHPNNTDIRTKMAAASSQTQRRKRQRRMGAKKGK
jgi:heme/copper-type cytochrome/quinol oxidase subunit 2